MRGRDCILEAFRTYGVEYLFGNPGTTELPLMDGLVNYPDIEYILALHEDVAVGMAAGYAQASGKAGVVNLHITPGLAHGLGNLYDAWRAHVPLVLTAGQHDSRLALQEPALAGDLVSLAKPFTKWAYEIRHPDEIGMAVQRAFKVALTPPMGPVFLSLPSDVMMAETSRGPMPLTVIEVSGSPGESAVREAASTLVEATHPVTIVGDGVAQADAVAEMVQLAEAIGCEVYSEHQGAALSFPYTHPQFFGRGLPNGPYLQRILTDADVVMFVGVTSQAPLLYFADPIIPPHTRVIHVDCNEWEIGKNNHVDVALLGDLRKIAAQLAEAVRSAGAVGAGAEKDTRASAAGWAGVAEASGVMQGTGITEGTEAVEFLERRERRLTEIVDRQQVRADKLREEREAGRTQKPLSPAHIMAELNEMWNDHMFLVDESVTTGRYVHGYLKIDRADSVIALKGGGLGYGMPAALGAQLARPDERVVAVIGDGSALYVIQALWNASKYNLPVVYLIVNNTSYLILKGGLRRLNGPARAAGVYPGMDLVGPEIDFVTCAKAFGVGAVRVENPEDVRPALEQALLKRRPYLIDFVIDKEVKEFLQ